MLASIGTISSGYTGGALDADASAFISAAGITNIQQRYAINKVVLDAKGHNWWTLCNAIYPMTGGTATTHKFNLKNPADTDAAFRLNFQGTWTHGATGALPDGSTAYADTFLVPSVALTANSSHISHYSRTNSSGAEGDIGCDDVAGTVRFAMYCKYGATYLGYLYATNPEVLSVSITDSLGHFIATRTGANAVEAYKNGASIDSDTFAVVLIPTTKLFLGAINYSGSAGDFSTRECAFATIGSGISSAIAALMNEDIQNFQRRLNRAV